ELVGGLEGAGIAYASVRGVGQVVTHPQLAGLWTAISAGDREVDVLPPPVTHGGSGPVLGPVPRLGQHTEAVLAEFAEDGPVPGPDPRPAPDDDGEDPPASATDSEAAGPGERRGHVPQHHHTSGPPAGGHHRGDRSRPPPR